MAAKLFVGNIPYTVNSDTLREVFAKIGEVVDAKVVSDRETGRSRGFGFVEYKSEADAKKAVKDLNESEIEGRKIFVSEARDKAPRDNQPS